MQKKGGKRPKWRQISQSVTSIPENCRETRRETYSRKERKD